MNKPCKECPWRRKAMAGWLGSQFSAEEWLALALSDEALPCHLTITDESDPFDHRPIVHCVGTGIFRANICKMPRDRNIPREAPDKKTVFASLQEFAAHHNQYGFTSASLTRERSR